MAKDDKIRILGVKCATRIGVPEWERRREQTLLIDAEMEHDITAAAKKDDVHLSVDYQAVERLMRQTARAKSRRLVETLAKDVASAILRAQRRVGSVLIRVHKRPKAMPRTAEVVLEIVRRRKKFGRI